jgi:DNA primase
MGITQELAVERAEADTRSFFKNLYFRLKSNQLTRVAFDGATGDMAAQYAMEGASGVVAADDAQAVRQAAEYFICQTLRPPTGPAPDDPLFGLVDMEPAVRLKFVKELAIEYGADFTDETD